MNRGAVFDLDGTLLPGTSAERLFVPYLMRRGIVGARQLATMAGTAAKLPFLGRTVALRQNKRYLAGVPVDVVGSHVPDFVKGTLLPRLSPALLTEVERLAREGYVVCLLSGTPDVIAEAVARRLGMHDAIGSDLEIVDGHYTGRIGRRHYFGEVKVRGVELLARRHDLDLEASCAFADHGTDVAFLDLFGRAFAVSPDRVLRSEAHRRGWTIVDANGRGPTGPGGPPAGRRGPA